MFRLSAAGQRPKFSVTMGLVISEIKGKWFYFATNILSMAIATVYILVFGFYAMCSYRVQKEMMEKSVKADMIIAKTPIKQAENEMYRFTPQIIADLKERFSHITQIVPIISNNFGLNAKNGNSLGSEIEGSTIFDPELKESTWLSGGIFSSDDAEEIVLTQPLYNLLVMDSSGKAAAKPDKVELFFERTVNGVRNSYRRNYVLAGVIDNAAVKGYIPLERINWLELWGSNKIEAVPESGGKPPEADLSLKSVRAYISSAVPEAEIKTIAEHFKISLRPVPEWNFLDYSCSAEPRLRMIQSAGNYFDLAELAELQKSHPGTIASYSLSSMTEIKVAEFPEKRLRLLALPEDDIRLKGLKTADGQEAGKIIGEFGRVILAESLESGDETLPWILVEQPGMPTSLAVNRSRIKGECGGCFFDALCSLQTMAYLKYEPKLDTFYLLVTENRDTVRYLQTNPVFGHFLRFSETADSFWKIRDNDSIYDPTPSELPSPMRLMTDGKLDEAPADGAAKEGLRVKKRAVMSSGEYQALAVIEKMDESVEKVIRSLNDSTLKIVPVRVLPENVLVSGTASTVAAIDPQDVKNLPFDWAGSLSSLAGVALDGSYYPSSRKEIEVAGNRFSLLRVNNEPFPKNIVLINAQDLDKYPLAIDSRMIKQDCEDLGGRLINQIELTIPNPRDYLALKDEIQKQGMEAVEMAGVKVTPINGYELKALGEGALIDPKQLNVLKTEQSFFDLNPLVKVSAAISRSPKGEKSAKAYAFCGSHEKDPYANLVNILAGKWLMPTVGSVILPEAYLVDNGLERESVLGKTISLIVNNEKLRDSAYDVYRLDFPVVGICAGDEGFITSDKALQIDLWLQGKMTFTERSGFVSGLENYKNSGFARCKIFVKQIDDVRPVASYLKKRGFETEDALENQEVIKRQARLLAFLVGMIVIGSVLNGIISVTITNLMNTKSRIFDIAVLRAYGAKKSLIFKMFTIHACLIGLISYLLAFPMSVGVVAIVKTCLAKGNFSVSLSELEEMTRIPIWDFSFWWLYLLAFALTMLFCLIGIWVSAIYASRIPITQALTRE